VVEDLGELVAHGFGDVLGHGLGQHGVHGGLGQRPDAAGDGGHLGDVLALKHAHPIGIDRKPGDGVLACDVTDGEQVAAVIAEATGQLGGRLDLLIHYAGVGPAVDVGRPPGEETREALDVNLLGPWRVTAAARPGLLEARGRVIITASLLAVITMPFAAAYTVSKRAWQTRRFDVPSYEVLLPHPQ
jgi:NAD(P)-dependent dehydrogenase (short-subunit alcohol dehydrogenase family)